MLDSQSLLLNGKLLLSAIVCSKIDSFVQLLAMMRKKSLKVINRIPSVHCLAGTIIDFSFHGFEDSVCSVT